jgi:AcrR family transcriptional regulator
LVKNCELIRRVPTRVLLLERLPEKLIWTDVIIGNPGLMATKRERPYQSVMRQRQAEETKHRILAASRKLLKSKGYSGMTIEAIAKKAEVAVPTVYAVFGSKTGILAELMDEATFGPDYERLVREAVETEDPQKRLLFAGRIARRVHDAASSTFDLMSGAGVVAPELAEVEKKREAHRYAAQGSMIEFLVRSGRLRPGVNAQVARDILWALTGRALYRMLVRERGWTSQTYEDWLGETLCQSLLT